MADAIAQLDRDGAATLRAAVPRALAESLITACPAAPTAGVRNLLDIVPAFRALAEADAIQAAVAVALGAPGFVTRSILFDKNPAANWALGFHQDTAIAVAERHDVPGFGPWSIKDGVHHVRPPAAVLERMVTIRVHLDPCGPDNGPLTIIAGSHREGLLSDERIARFLEHGERIDLTAEPGDAVLMRPLVLHGSRKAEAPRHRRVAHFEFACEALPPPLRWP